MSLAADSLHVCLSASVTVSDCTQPLLQRTDYTGTWRIHGVQARPLAATWLQVFSTFKKSSFLPYQHYTQPVSYTGTTAVCVQNFAAERRAISDFITDTTLKYLVDD